MTCIKCMSYTRKPRSTFQGLGIKSRMMEQGKDTRDDTSMIEQANLDT